jgi:hypothetical protein
VDVPLMEPLPTDLHHAVSGRMQGLSIQ